MGKIEGRSLGQIAWMRLKRDKVAIAGFVIIILLILMAIFANLIIKTHRAPPNDFNQDLIDPRAAPSPRSASSVGSAGTTRSGSSR